MNSGYPYVSLGDGNDTAVVSGFPIAPRGFGFAPFEYWISGGAGSDGLAVGAHAIARLAGSTGNDRLTGGSGADRLVGGPGSDRIDGGAGRDTASWADHSTPVRLDLRRAGPQGSTGEQDFVLRVEIVVAGRAADTIVGSPQPDRIEAGGGNDVIDVAGGGGDFVVCSTGIDRVRADQTDRLTACERVTRVG